MWSQTTNARLPKNLAGLRIECDERSFRPAGVDNEFAVDDQRRGAKSPDQLMVAVELLDQIDPPNGKARFQLDARQVAKRTKKVGMILVHQRRSAGHVVVIELTLGRVLELP